MAFLNEMDKIRDELAAKFPGWQIWYVPQLNRTVTWCARPWPLIHADSSEGLERKITETVEGAASESTSLIVHSITDKYT